MYSNSQNRMRMRLYHTRQDVFPNYVFTPIVSPPAASPDFKPRVDWEHFHSVEPLPSAIHARGHLPPDLQRVTSHWGLGEYAQRYACLVQLPAAPSRDWWLAWQAAPPACPICGRRPPTGGFVSAHSCPQAWPSHQW